MLKTFGIVLAATSLTACASMTTLGGATNSAAAAEICRQWGESLPTRSRSDTALTKKQIQEGYARFALSCPDFAYLVP